MRLGKMIARKQVGDVNVRVYETPVSLVALDDQDYVVAVEWLDVGPSKVPATAVKRSRLALDRCVVHAETALGVSRF